MMRREGFELKVGKPEVITRDDDGKRHEPMEQLVDRRARGVHRRRSRRRSALRKGQMVRDGEPRHRPRAPRVPRPGPRPDRLPHRVPDRHARHGLLNHLFDGWEPWHGDYRTRPERRPGRGPRAAARPPTRSRPPGARRALHRPGTEVYEGMIVGENARGNDLDVNMTKEKKLTNMRASTSDERVRLIPPRLLNLEQTLELIREDELRRGHPEEHPHPQDRALRRKACDAHLAAKTRARFDRDRSLTQSRTAAAERPGDATGRATFRARSSSSASPSPAAPCLQPPRAPSASSSAPQPPRPSPSD